MGLEEYEKITEQTICKSSCRPINAVCFIMVLLLICIVKHPQDQLLTRALNTQEIAIRISANKGYISGLSYVDSKH